jgi:pimeloyl-ACP methyl ester carboxylesterase
MINKLLISISVLMLVSCNTYKIAERHLDKKMGKADLVKAIWINEAVSDTVEYWDNKKLDKPVMVLVHGFGATTKYQWDKQVKMLSENYRLVLPNLYHFGKTRPGSEKYSVADQVDLVHNLIMHLEIEDYSLMGVSYGGLISMELANEFKNEVKQLIVFDAPIKYMDSNDINVVKNHFDVPSIEELFVPEDPEGLKKLMFLATGKKSRLPKWMYNEFHKEAYLSNLENMRGLITSLIDGLEEYQSHDYDLEIPILLIWGENDMVVTADRGKMLQEHIGENAQYHVIGNSAHMPNMTKSKKFNSILAEFLIENKVIN